MRRSRCSLRIGYSIDYVCPEQVVCSERHMLRDCCANIEDSGMSIVTGVVYEVNKSLKTTFPGQIEPFHKFQEKG
jgi:hypothetical protein